MTEMLRAFGNSGLPPICAGDVFIIRNADVRMNVPPGSGDDGTHRVVVVGTPSLLQDDRVHVVPVVPCTSSPRHPTGLLEVPISQTEEGFVAASYAIAYLAQPVPRSALTDRKGTVSERTLERILAAVAKVLGLLDDTDASA